MARPKNLTPTYALHRASARGQLIWTDAIGVRREKLLPGLYDSPESLQAKARLELEICTSPTRGTAAHDAISVAELFALFFNHAGRYFVDADGHQTKEVSDPTPTPRGEPVPLTPKQRRFCEEYLVDLNATRAAIRAGYSKRSAHNPGGHRRGHAPADHPPAEQVLQGDALGGPIQPPAG